MRGGRFIVVLLAAAALAALAVPSAAPAAVNSKVTVGVGFRPEVGNPFFKGRVTSKRRSCKAGRTVVVYRVRSHRKRVRFGATRTGSDGRWRLEMNARMKTGGYLAKVKARGSCASDKTQLIAVGQDGPGGTGRSRP